MTVATLIAVIVSEPDEKGEVFPLLLPSSLRRER